MLPVLTGPVFLLTHGNIPDERHVQSNILSSPGGVGKGKGWTDRPHQLQNQWKGASLFSKETNGLFK